MHIFGDFMMGERARIKQIILNSTLAEQIITVQSVSMLESSVMGSRTLNCYRHKSEPATHICIDGKCTSNPLMCMQCFVDQVNRHYHYDHEKSILTFEDGIDAICTQIKGHTVNVNKIYKSTIGRSEFSSILSQVEKGQLIYDQLEERINSIKNQVQLELDLLIKQFQKSLLVEKQQYFKMLDNYQRSFAKNVEYLQNHSQLILDFNTSVKYYANRNNFYLKMVSQSRKKSEWVSKIKKSLQNISKNVQNSNYSTQLSSVFSSANRIKLDSWPAWKGEESSAQRNNEIKFLIKRAMNQWIYIPQLKQLDKEVQNGFNPGIQTGIGIDSITKNYFLGNNGK